MDLAVSGNGFEGGSNGDTITIWLRDNLQIRQTDNDVLRSGDAL
jgi:hypothetical protein